MIGRDRRDSRRPRVLEARSMIRTALLLRFCWRCNILMSQTPSHAYRPRPDRSRIECMQRDIDTDRAHEHASATGCVTVTSMSFKQQPVDTHAAAKTLSSMHMNHLCDVRAARVPTIIAQVLS